MNNWQRKTAVFLLTLLTLAFMVAAGRYLQAVQLWLAPPASQAAVAEVAEPAQSFSKPQLWEWPFVLSELEATPTENGAEDSTWMRPIPRSPAFPAQGVESVTQFFVQLGGETAVLPKADEIEEQTLVATPPPAPTAIPLPEPAQLIIPSLGVTRTITNVLVRDGQWDITQLGNQIGHLQTTGTRPEDETAMTFVGHVTLPRPELIGPFVDLIKLDHGETIIYRWQGTDYLYAVDATYIVPPTSVNKLYHDDNNPATNHLILATCTGWNRSDRAFDERLVIRAQLIAQQPVQKHTNAPTTGSFPNNFR